MAKSMASARRQQAHNLTSASVLSDRDSLLGGKRSNTPGWKDTVSCNDKSKWGQLVQSMEAKFATELQQELESGRDRTGQRAAVKRAANRSAKWPKSGPSRPAPKTSPKKRQVLPRTKLQFYELTKETK